MPYMELTRENTEIPVDSPTRDYDDGDIASFTQLWDRTSVMCADRIFLVFSANDGSTHEWTYAEFDEVVRSTAGRLSELGIGAGDGIHVCLRNCPAFVAVWLAAARLGAWINPVDPTTGRIELAQQMRRTDAKLGVCAPDRSVDYRAAAADVGVPVLEVATTAAGLSDLTTAAATATVPVPDPNARLAVMFTSGTTSAPKGVVLTQRNYRVVAREMAAAARLVDSDRWLVTLPLFHGNAQYYCFCAAIEVGASVALTEQFSASRWVRQAIELHATVASLFAAPIRMILARTPEDQSPAALRHVWFAQNLGSLHHAEFGRLAGVAPRQLYGMTETIAIVTADVNDPPRSDVIGRPLPGRRVRLVDRLTLEPVPAGTPGVITVAGVPGDDLFLEYLDAEDTTARTLVRDAEGTTWLFTGDLAVDRGDGELTFVGRADDVIKVAGENVSLTELEAALAEAPGVLEAAVLGEPDPMRDRVPVAYVVARPGHDLDTAELQDWAATRLARAARPARWHVIDELPRTSVGKVRRFKLSADVDKGDQ
ncbi:MAG: AMP-binding protein [Gordonia sp. (in: high G+C Gram-positive bacteria)]|uniref:class I adenylate-forming enzyme family protein n=1 Tax=Gordonia sp. (in: high G+C Gram-positive bacteria) TaxID=84139 RepID=UPI003C70EC2D